MGLAREKNELEGSRTHVDGETGLTVTRKRSSVDVCCLIFHQLWVGSLPVKTFRKTDVQWLRSQRSGHNGAPATRSQNR
jgi:hypothetical protein